NSLVLSRAPTPEVVGCDDLEVTSSALETALEDNLALGDMDTAWFIAFNMGNFHLSAMAPPALASAAVWKSTDSSTDIDGDPRPTIDGTADYAGADIPQ